MRRVIFSRSKFDFFEALFDTTKTSTGSSASNQIKLVFTGVFVANGTIDWGDGIKENSTLTGTFTHTYSTAGVYTVKIIGASFRLSFNNTNDRLKIIEIKKWGNNYLFSNAFRGCANLVLDNVRGMPKMDPVLSNVFSDCTSLVTINNINNWNFSAITNIAQFFSNCSNLNQNFNLSLPAVTNLGSLFLNCAKLNSPININAPLVTSLVSLFQGCTILNSSVILSTGNLININSLFRDAKTFNQDISYLNVSNVTNFDLVFYGATAFNQPLSWSVSNGTMMNGVFLNAPAFNQDISGWDFNKNVDLTNFMNGKTFANYDKLYYNNLLQKWASVFIGTGRTNTTKSINMGTIRYTAAGKPYRDALVADGWTVIDGGLTT